MNKAVKVRTDYGTYYNTVTYEYRGYTYDIEFGNGHTTFAHSPRELAEIHKAEQERIDRLIENSKKPFKYEDTAEYGFEVFWKMVNGEC